METRWLAAWPWWQSSFLPVLGLPPGEPCLPLTDGWWQRQRQVEWLETTLPLSAAVSSHNLAATKHSNYCAAYIWLKLEEWWYLTDDGETPVEHLASAPLHSHELLPLQRCTRTQKTLQKSCCLLLFIVSATNWCPTTDKPSSGNYHDSSEDCE